MWHCVGKFTILSGYLKIEKTVQFDKRFIYTVILFSALWF